jgi:hypothetical protein
VRPLHPSPLLPHYPSSPHFLHCTSGPSLSYSFPRDLTPSACSYSDEFYGLIDDAYAVDWKARVVYAVLDHKVGSRSHAHGVDGLACTPLSAQHFFRCRSTAKC